MYKKRPTRTIFLILPPILFSSLFSLSLFCYVWAPIFFTYPFSFITTLFALFIIQPNHLYAHHFPHHYVKAPTFILIQCHAQRSFWYRCNRSNFTDDGKDRRSLAQHLRHCKAPTKKFDFHKPHDSGTDPFPFLSKKRRLTNPILTIYLGTEARSGKA